MILFFIIVCIVSVLEWAYMRKHDLKYERTLFIFAAILTFAFGYYYFSDPFRDSFSYRVLDYLGLKD